MTSLYSYILRYDDGAAPNPFGGTCTLAICKPVIRRTAKVGDWVIGTGSKRAKCNDGSFQNHAGLLVYAMKISETMSMHDYDAHCKEKLHEKIPVEGTTDWNEKIGDCLYYLEDGKDDLTMREFGQHTAIKHKKWDESGKMVLLSNTFYYFGDQPIELPPRFQSIIKENQGHRKIINQELIQNFEKWIGDAFENKHIGGDPHLMEHTKRQMRRAARSLNKAISHTSEIC